MKAALVATHLAAIDAASYDVLFQFGALRDTGAFGSVELFAESCDALGLEEYPVGTADDFEIWCRDNPDGLVVYHYTDGRSRFSDLLRFRSGPTIVRWQNATPPWFTLTSQPDLAMHSLAGYDTVVGFIGSPKVAFWPSSDFTQRQLMALGASAERCRKVFPATRYLMRTDPPHPAPTGPKKTIDLLFVSRIAPNKGHAHAVHVASRAQALSGVPVRLVFVGRADPTLKRFNADLRAAVAGSGATVEFRGSVSEEELAACYRDADVFLCMSEHEGFGLPVMEAMRSGLPVVARAVTAVAETLGGHPFAFREFDVDLFATAILTLRDERARERVLGIQAELLTRYTADIVRNQLATAVRAIRSAPGPAAGPTRTTIDQALDDAFHRIRAASPRPTVPVHDSGQNLVSRYDLAQYPVILDALKKRKFAPLDRVSPDPAVILRPEEFSAPLAELDKDGLLQVPAGSYDGRHLIYGPYVPFPVGRYVATIQFTPRDVSHDGRFELDVSCPGQGVLATTTVSTPARRGAAAPTLAFEIAQDGTPVEFRLRPVSTFVGALSFEGVSVREAAGRERSPGLRARSARRRFSSYLPRWMARRRATELFRTASTFADARRWPEAVEAYKAALAIDPTDFALRVQLGHALKEARRFGEAEIEYLRALEMSPEDADLHLQLGHFYKVSGKTADAVRFYLRALGTSGPAKDAAAELIGLNVPPARWSEDS